MIAPYWTSRDGRHVLYNADCLEVLPTLAGVDAVVTDPPFNAGKEFKNDSMTDEAWKAFCSSFAVAVAEMSPVNALIEVGKNDSGMRAAFDSVMPYRWAIALNYTNAMRQGAVGFSNFGLVLWYGEKCYRRFMDRIDSALHSTIDEFSHPSPKEISHYRQLVVMFSPEGGTVCDPFTGSGTTGVACIRTGRRFIGIEISRDYCEIAVKRMERELSQPRLPGMEPERITQASFLEAAV